MEMVSCHTPPSPFPLPPSPPGPNGGRIGPVYTNAVGTPHPRTPPEHGTSRCDEIHPSRRHPHALARFVLLVHFDFFRVLSDLRHDVVLDHVALSARDAEDEVVEGGAAQDVDVVAWILLIGCSNCESTG